MRKLSLIADYHYAQMLNADDVETREGLGRDAIMRGIAAQLDAAGVEYEMPIPQSERPPQFGLSDADMKRRIADLQFMLPITKAALASGEAFRRLGLAVLRKNVAALEAICKRTQGDPIETPPIAALGSASTASGDTLKAALEGWKKQPNAHRAQ